MMSQLDKSNVFFAFSVNEIHRPNLLKILHNLSDSFKDVHVEDALIYFTRSHCNHLVSKDSVTCAVYFNKLVDIITAMLQAKTRYSPIDPYRTVDYSLCIELQYRRSPHAHVSKTIREKRSPKTYRRLSRSLLSVLTIYSAYTKREETACSFNMPHRSMTEQGCCGYLRTIDAKMRCNQEPQNCRSC